MKRIFDMDHPFVAFLGKGSDLLLVNLLWLIFSIPIITIGASTTAFYYVSFKIMNGEEPYLFKSFFKSFKENFRQATVIWLIFLAAFAFVAFDIYSVVGMKLFGPTLGKVMLCIFAFIAIILVFMFVYVFAVQSRFENTIKNTMKNAAYLGISYFGYTIVMCACDVLFVVLGIVIFPMILPLIIPVLPIWFNTLIMKKIFVKYIQE